MPLLYAPKYNYTMELKRTNTSLSDDYPPWHYQPLRLLLSEIANPMGVIAQFFSVYQLPQARKYLKDMLEDAMSAMEVHAVNYLTFYNNMERLMEAAWLLMQADKEKSNATG